MSDRDLAARWSAELYEKARDDGRFDGLIFDASDIAKLGLTLQDFGFFDVLEAFADHASGVIDRERLNIHGSSLAAAPPFAATGGRIRGHLAHMLSRAGVGRGLISICATGGQGVVAVVEQ